MFPLSRRYPGAVVALFAVACAAKVYGQGATLTPNPRDFGSIPVGQSSSAILFTFTNNSGSSELISSVIPSNSPEFPVQPFPMSTCPTLVPAHGTCTLSIVFSPLALGSANGQVVVNSNNATNPTLTLTLTGNGIPSTTTATLTPTSATFSNTNVGSTSPAIPFLLTNTGNSPIDNIQVGVSTDYSATPTCGTTSLAPSASCNINVVFSPTAAGVRNGTLTVNSTSSSGRLTSSLTGTGISNLSGLTLSINSLAMGNYEVGASSGLAPKMTVTLTNNDTTAITFTPPVGPNGVSFPVAGDFTASNTCAQTLSPGASCSLSVTFLPTITGTRIGSVIVYSTGSTGTQTLTLSGNGTDYTMTTTTPSVAVVQGSTATYAIALTPVSGYTDTISLRCSGLTAAGTHCLNADAALGPAMTVNFTITTTPKNLGGVIANGVAPSAWGSRMTWLLGVCSLWLLALAGRTRRLARAAGLIALLLALLLPAGGCSGKQPTPDPNATQPGTYTFTLTSVDSAQLSKTLSLTLVVTAQ